MLVRQRREQRHECRAVDIDRRQSVADIVAAAGRPLRLEPRRQHPEQRDDACARGTAGFGAVAVFLGKIRRDARRKATGALQARVDQLQAARPAQPLLATYLMGEAKDERTLRGILRQQRRRRRQALGQQQDLGPAGPRPFIVIDRDRAGALAGPGLERLAVVDESHRGPVDALDVQDALCGFAPWAWHAADHDHAPSTARDRLVDAYIFEGHLADVDVFPEADPVIDRLHLFLRRLVGPRRAWATRLAFDHVIELHAVRALQVVLRLGRALEQVHAHGVARKVDVATDLECALALGDRLAVPCRGMGHWSRSLMVRCLEHYPPGWIQPGG